MRLSTPQRRALRKLASGASDIDPRTLSALERKGMIKDLTITATGRAELTKRPGIRLSPVHRSAHPIVKELLNAVETQQLSQRAISVRAGYAESTLATWRGRASNPHLRAVADVANALGFELTLRPLNRSNEGVSSQAGDRAPSGNHSRGLHSGADNGAGTGARLSPSRD